MIKAIKGEYEELIKDILKNHKKQINKPNAITGKTPLMVATSLGYMWIVELLIKHKVDLNLQDKDGYTALMWAVHSKLINTSKLLIKVGANVNLVSKWGDTTLTKAAEKDLPEVFETLIKYEADINHSDIYGDTALMIAIEKGHTKAAKELIYLGADVNYQDNDSKSTDKDTAIIKAVRTRNKKVVKCLLGRDANLNLKNKKGESALNIAITKKFNDIAKLLINSGADI